MKKIQNMLKIKPDLEKLNLSFLQIETLDDIAYELYHFENLKEIDLSCNRLRRLPADLSILKTVERLDLSNNLFDNIPNVLSALATMPNLMELNLTYDPAKLQHHIGHYLPLLQVINGEIIKAGGEPQMTNPIIKVNESGKFDIEFAKSNKNVLAHAFILYEDELLNLRHFHQNVYTIIQDGNNNPKNQSKSFLESVKAIEEGVKYGYKFNEDMTEKAKDGVYKTNFTTYEVKRDYIFNIIKNYLMFLKEKYPKISSATENLFKLTAFLLSNLEKKAPYLNEEIFKTEDLDDVSVPEDKRNGFEIKAKEETDTEKVLLKIKMSEIEKELEELRRENDEMYSFLVNSAKKDVIEYAKKINKNTYANPQESRKLGETAKTNSFLNLKSYTLRQINDLIYDIMENKKAYDEKCLKTKALPETLESYLFVYFKQKYGLKDLILVEVSSVIEKIKGFSTKSVEVDVFKRILKNEIDEKFFWMLQTLKGDFKSKLQNYYLEKIKKAGTLAEAVTFANSRINGNLEKEEGEYLLSLSYKAAEFKTVNASFKIYFDENDINVNNKNVLPYGLFLEFVFAHELEKHLEELRYVSEFFNNADEDKNGVITKKQFLDFLDVVAIRNAQVDLQSLIQQADPNGSNRITFSKMVDIFSSNYADKERQLNLIQFLNKI